MSYLPDAGAVLDGTPFTRQLSQRDLSLQIPVNYVTVPGVALTAACFPGNRYEDAATIRCFSNLLAVGFRRFYVDIYWDVSRSVWSLCPAQLGSPSALHAPRSVEGDVYRGNLRPRQDGANSNSLTIASTSEQTSSGTLVSASTTTTLSPGSSTTSNSTATAARPTNTNLAGTVIQVGPYECTRSVNLDLVLDILSSHLDNTQTNVNATIKYLVLSLHEAVIPGTNPGSLSGDQLPHGDSLLSTIITSAATNLSNYLYSPDDLGDQRADLNASFSWFAVNPSKEPSPSYFTVDESNRKSFTPNGWPAESFVEMTQAKRLIVAAGDGGFQLQDYNNTTDAASIFASSYLEDRVSVGLAPNGDIISGCLFDPATTTIGAPNNSWASFGISMKSLTDVQAYMNAADSLTRCGISSDLNTTLGGVTADADYQPYHQFAQSTIWSWAPDEPVNNTAPGSDAPSISNRCAVLNATSGYWQAEDCGTPHFSACRSFGQPYKWSIGGADTTYDKAELGCKEGTEFDTPRTALENRHLLHTWRSTLASRDTDGDKLLWVNFNDLDAKACWVIGQNATCPYLNDTDRERVIIVPVVAAVVVFVLAALTVFVKCASNRQNTKRRRKRGDDGWDYEGVPS